MKWLHRSLRLHRDFVVRTGGIVLANTGTEKASYGFLDKFLFYVTPIVFLLVLLGVLLSLFNYNVMDVVLEAGQKVPVVNQILPKPHTAAQSTSSSSNNQSSDVALQKTEIAKLTQQNQQKDQQLQKLQQDNKLKDQSIQSLQKQAADLQEQLKQKTLTDQQYQQHIQDMANMYAQMIPSKSSAIMSNLSLKENALLLSQMQEKDRVNILQKLDPKTAADLTVLLKDQIPVKDQEIAALQDRVTKLLTQQSPTVTQSDLAQTIAGMDTNTAANLLIEMDKTDENQVIQLLTAMSTTSRSGILGAIAQSSNTLAADLTTKLIK